LGGDAVLTEQSVKLEQADLMALGLIMRADSRKRREYVCEQLRIGYANGKQIEKRLNMFGISKTQLETIMASYRGV